MFISEISPVSFRGLLVGIYGIFGVFAILISQIFGLPQLLGTEHLWPLLFAVPAVPAVVQLLILPFCPESPFFLLFVRHNRAAADMALMKLRDDADVVIGEISEMVDEKTKIDSQPKLRWGQLFQPPCRWPLILAIVVMLAQQLSGINAVSLKL